MGSRRMTFSSRIIGFSVLLCITAFCASCLTASLPKSARLDDAQSSPDMSASLQGAGDKSVVGKWELLYQLNDKGERQNPRDQTKTQIEFTDNGQVVFNRFDNEHSDNVKSRTGKFTLDKNLISITDDAGNTVKWPFQIASDSLIISMPEVNKKFHWRRIN
jgi:hypothetical protein